MRARESVQRRERVWMRERKRVQSREGVWIRKRVSMEDRWSVDESERECRGEKEC